MLGLAELGLCLFVAIGALYVGFWAVFGLLGVVVSVPIFGLSKVIKVDPWEHVAPAAFGTIIGWPICMIIGGLLYAVGWSGVWIYSPLGYLHSLLYNLVFSCFFNNGFGYGGCRDGAAIISYCGMTLLVTIVIVLSIIVRGEIRSAREVQNLKSDERPWICRPVE